jgi:hypothetical protein
VPPINGWHPEIAAILGRMTEFFSVSVFGVFLLPNIDVYLYYLSYEYDSSAYGSCPPGTNPPN